MEKKEYLIKTLEQFHIVLTDEQTEQLLLFYEMLIEKNKVMNLTAITEFEETCEKHFLDSLSLCRLFGKCAPLPSMDEKSKQKLTLIDVGCGAGFPGIPLAIAFPFFQVTLLDSLNKRVLFLQEVIDALHLSNCKAYHGRAEEFARLKDRREQYDLAVSRAVAGLPVLCEYCLPFVKKDGIFVAYKSAKIKEEAAEAGRSIRLLGGAFEMEEEFTLPAIHTHEKTDHIQNYRNLYVIRKVSGTPKAYPRKAGTAAKNPL
ncbi:MAG: 16S rRNA (guanine(527)-N(7))-methyltransferase RsmG [Lachnospiraceae bacterium]|nr:16S rRNA (guanine(527)-N(7))-methyltransferase RsmG [Lachnospiraceae bacterium]